MRICNSILNSAGIATNTESITIHLIYRLLTTMGIFITTDIQLIKPLITSLIKCTILARISTEQTNNILSLFSWKYSIWTVENLRPRSEFTVQTFVKNYTRSRIPACKTSKEKFFIFLHPISVLNFFLNFFVGMFQQIHWSSVVIEQYTRFASGSDATPKIK